MRLFKSHENLGWRIHNSRRATFHHFGVSSNPSLQGYWFHVGHSSAFWPPENVILQRLREPRIKRTLLTLRYSYAFWWPEKTVSQVSWDTRLKVPWLPVVSYSTFCWPGNMIHGGYSDHQTTCTWLHFEVFLCFGSMKRQFRKVHEF
jgi:hypothetical protein